MWDGHRTGEEGYGASGTRVTAPLFDHIQTETVVIVSQIDI